MLVKRPCCYYEIEEEEEDHKVLGFSYDGKSAFDGARS